MEYIKPILGTVTQGLYLQGDLLLLNGETLIDNVTDQLSSISEFKVDYPTIKLIDLYLRIHNFQDLINSFVIKENSNNKLISIGINEDHYSIANNENLKSFDNMLDYSNILESLDSFLLNLDSLESRIDSLIDVIFEQTEDELINKYPLYLKTNGSISDNLSLSNTSIITGESWQSENPEKVTYDGSLATYLESLQTQPSFITYDAGKTIIRYSKISANENDLIEITIKYTFSDRIPSSINFEDNPIRFDLYKSKIIDLYEESVTLLIPLNCPKNDELKEIYPRYIRKYMDLFLLDIDLDRILVYPISDNIKEYYVQSGKLIRI